MDTFTVNILTIFVTQVWFTLGVVRFIKHLDGK
jgi:hypothetical protein